MKKIQKLQVTLNEVKRMQQLAGIEPINELSAGLRNRAAIKARDRGGKDNMIGQSKSESIFEIPKKYQDIAYKIAESISTYFTDLVFTSPKGIKDCKVNIVNPYLIKDATASKDVYIDLSFYSTDVYNNTAEKKYKLKETFALYRMYMRKKFFGLSSKIEESTSDSFSEYIAKCKLNGTDRMPINSNGESVSGIDSEIKSLLNKLKSELGAKINEGNLSWKEMDRYAKAISNLTGTDSNAVKNFIEDNDLDAKKLYSYAKSGKSEDRMNFATALVGNPGNKYEKMIITKFGLKESINEGKVNKKYTHFIVNKKTNKILNGFDYKGLDNSSIQDYFMEDLKDMDLNKRDVSLLTAKSLMSKNIDPFDWSNWSN